MSENEDYQLGFKDGYVVGYRAGIEDSGGDSK